MLKLCGAVGAISMSEYSSCSVVLITFLLCLHYSTLDNANVTMVSEDVHVTIALMVSTANPTDSATVRDMYPAMVSLIRQPTLDSHTQLCTAVPCSCWRFDL